MHNMHNIASHKSRQRRFPQCHVFLFVDLCEALLVVSPSTVITDTTYLMTHCKQELTPTDAVRYQTQHRGLLATSSTGPLANAETSFPPAWRPFAGSQSTLEPCANITMRSHGMMVSSRCAVKMIVHEFNCSVISCCMRSSEEQQ